MKVAIIGAGAAGMAAAITAAASGRRQITLFERQSKVGRKLLATGNGRCNLSNRAAGPDHYHGTAPDFVLPALTEFSVANTLDFFWSLGLYTVTEPGGRVYPYSDQAGSVVDVLRFGLDRSNLRVRLGCEVLGIRRTENGFLLKTAEDTECFDKVIVACGGAAGTKLGGGLSGYQLLRSLGHHCSKLYPSLVQLKTDSPLVRSLKGVRANASLRLTYHDAALALAYGEVQFTDYGVSGPAVFDLSRVASTSTETVLHLDLVPNMSEDELLSTLCIRISRYPALSCQDLLTGIVHNQVGRVILRACEVPLVQPLSSIHWKQLTDVIETCHNFELNIVGTMGMDCAQVTAGGIYTQEFDPKTMESRIVPGLYAAGEVLDVDGDCGGYNLQWAWSSGLLAGQLRERNADDT